MDAAEMVNGHAVRLYWDRTSSSWVLWCKTCDLVEQNEHPADGVRAMMAHTHTALTAQVAP